MKSQSSRPPVAPAEAAAADPAEPAACRRFAASPELLARLFEISPDATLLVGADGRILAANAQTERTFGYAREELLGQPVELLLPQRLAGPHVEELFGRRKDGSEVPAEILLSPLETEQGVLALAVVRDVTELEFFKHVIETTKDPIYWLSPEQGFRFVYVNEAACRHYGYPAETLLQMCVPDWDPNYTPESLAALWEDVQREKSRTLETLHRRGDGTVVPVVVTVNYVAFGGKEYAAGTIRDITDRKQLEERLLLSQRMEALGQLAGGVAHDFNNLLTIISGHSDLLLLEMGGGDHPLKGAVGAIRDAGERAAMLTRQLLAFSSKQILEPKLLDLNDVVSNAERLLRRLIGEDILLTSVLDPGLQQVKVDPGQLEQVVLNLAVNARDAMPKGGRLTIATGNARLSAEDCKSLPDCKPGSYVQLSVSDTGHGMTEEVKAHIFEPFFTTKEHGKGTGLGLSTVYGIIKQSEGHIAVDSKTGIGTTFRVFLPAWQGGEPVLAAETERRAPAHGSETILVVEDEVMVGEVARLALVKHGYFVLQARSGREALELSASHAGLIDLVVTDLVMPEMSGWELAQHLRRRQPTLKILYMSGYAEDTIAGHGLVEGTDAFLPKPFTPVVLARKVRQLLSGESA